MEDSQIVALYWSRSENAIAESERQYGKYCYTIANGILRCHEDSEECVNDTWLHAWDAMPPHKPSRLSTFLGKITRNLALHRVEKAQTEKRGAGQVPLALEELSECIPAQERDSVVDEMALAQILDRFLGTLPEKTRRMFMQRYWYLRSIREIAQETGMSENHVKVTLHRTREKLRTVLDREGIEV